MTAPGFLCFGELIPAPRTIHLHSSIDVAMDWQAPETTVEGAISVAILKIRSTVFATRSPQNFKREQKHLTKNKNSSGAPFRAGFPVFSPGKKPGIKPVMHNSYSPFSHI
jgi:hypothetical protein